MRLVEGTVEVGGDDGRYPDVDAFVEALDGVAAEHDVTVQAFDARYVASRRHLERALELADRERSRGDAIARDRAVEVLLYAAGRRQIDRALEMGVAEGVTPAVVLVDAGGENDTESPATVEKTAADAVADLLETDETLGEYDEARLRAFFDVGDSELAATTAGLDALVLERVALLVVER